MSRLDKLLKMLEAEPGDAFVLYGIAQEHAKQDRHQEAVAFYDRCLSIDPAYLYAYYHKSVSQQELGDLAQACESARQGIAQARRLGDNKALSELQTLLDSLG